MVLFSFEEAAKELASLGLTGNQARAYVALVHFKVAPVREIARLSKIRREEIYRMMPRLERLGLVEKILGKPIRYKSVPPKEAISLLFERQRESAKRKTAELAEKRKHLLGKLKYGGAKRTVDEKGPSFILISDRKQATRKIATMIRNAKKSIDIATPRYGLQLGYAYEDTFREAVKKGVRARILLEIVELDGLTVKTLRDAESSGDAIELRHVDNLTSHIVIVDGAEVIVGTFLIPTEEKHVDLWTNSPAYVGVMNAFFNRVWQDSTDIKSRIGYLQTGRLVESTEVIKGREAIYERGYEVYSRAKTDKFTITDGPGLELSLRDFSSASIELKKRGVRVRYLTKITDQNLQAAEEMSKEFEVRHMDYLPFRALLTETEAMFSWLPVKEMPEAAIYSNSPELVRMVWAMAENAWKNAVDAKARIDEIRKVEPIGRKETRGR